MTLRLQFWNLNVFYFVIYVCFFKVTQVEKELENIKKAINNLKLS